MANPWPEPRRGWREFLQWKLGRGGRAEAAFPEATAAAPLAALPSAELHAMPERGWTAIWLGHAFGRALHPLRRREECSPIGQW